MKHFRLLSIVPALLLFEAYVPAQKYIPPPLRLFVSFESTWDSINEVLSAGNMKLLEANRAQGRILTDFQEFSSGPLAESSLAKIGEKPKIPDGYVSRVEFQYDVTVELIGAKETLVTVATNVRALKRDFLGTETWIEVASNGMKEDWLLTQLGRSLFGETFQLDRPRKDFWRREAPRIPNITETEAMRKAPGPERP